MKDKLNLIDDIYACLLIDKKTFEVLDGNKLAKNYYFNDKETAKLEELFLNCDDLKSFFEKKGEEFSKYLSDFTSVKYGLEQFLCDIEICYCSESLVFLVIKEKSSEHNFFVEELVELDNNPVFVVDPENKYELNYFNDHFLEAVQMMEFNFSSTSNISFLSLLQENRVKAFTHDIDNQLEKNNECDTDIEITLDGHYFQMFRFNALKSHIDGKLYGVLISIKKQSELMKKIEYDQQYFNIMQEFSKDLLFRIDIQKKTLVHRGDISKFIDLRSEMENFPECIRVTRLVHPDDLEGYIAFCYRMMHGASAVFEPRFQFKNGVYEKYRLQGKPLFSENGEPVQVVGKSENIQKYIEIEAKANYDSLTSTLNKQSFREVVENMLNRSVEKDKFALLFLDFDNFKKVNDTMGHAFGDFLLEVTGKRIQNSIRSHDKIGRVGGDEFVIFFQHAPSEESTLERAEAILHSLRREYSDGDLTYSIRASIGIAMFPQDGTTYDELYQCADVALYKSKERGKDVASLYSQCIKKADK
ncbi:MAG: sensor domain-containing diguanylate cyclase [Clostridia bacterium]